jgi:hypothetical protein
LMTAFLETCFLFCFFLTPGRGHAAGKAKKVTSNTCITLAHPGGSWSWLHFRHIVPKSPSACYSVIVDI